MGYGCGEDAMPISLPIEARANELLTRSPLALLIALVLDQQVPLEKAFSSPQVLVDRLGHEPTAAELADFPRSEEHTSELQSQFHLVCRLLLEKKNTQ